MPLLREAVGLVGGHDDVIVYDSAVGDFEEAAVVTCDEVQAVSEAADAELVEGVVVDAFVARGKAFCGKRRGEVARVAQRAEQSLVASPGGEHAVVNGAPRLEVVLVNLASDLARE